MKTYHKLHKLNKTSSSQQGELNSFPSPMSDERVEIKPSLPLENVIEAMVKDGPFFVASQPIPEEDNNVVIEFKEPDSLS
jgi:hypothetical protein